MPHITYMKMRLTNFFRHFVVALSFFLIAIVAHDASAQFYIGGSLGNSFIKSKVADSSIGTVSIEGNDFGWKVFGGFGAKFLGAEGGYRELGKVQMDVLGQKIESKITGWDVAAKGNINIGPVFILAKAGAFFASAKNTVGPISYSESSTNFLWGVGGGLKLGMLGLRVEYESLDMSEDNNLAMLTFGATIQFGGRKK